jgi:hypothetical protein
LIVQSCMITWLLFRTFRLVVCALIRATLHNCSRSQQRKTRLASPDQSPSHHSTPRGPHPYSNPSDPLFRINGFSLELASRLLRALRPTASSASAVHGDTIRRTLAHRLRIAITDVVPTYRGGQRGNKLGWKVELPAQQSSS